MESKSYLLSSALHLGILALFLTDWAMMRPDFDKTVTPVIMVDLSKVQIGELTNLPAEIKKAKAAAAAAKPQEAPAPVVNKTPPTAAPKPEPVEPVKPKEEPAPKDSVAVQAPKPQETKETKKEAKKPEPKKTPPTPSKTTKGGDLKSLLAAVDKIKKPAATAPSTGAATNTPAGSNATGATGQEVQEGIKGGTGGSLMQPLTISEKDLIVTKLRGCWNVDAGATGIEDMVIEVRAFINKDGRVKEVKIVNMQNDASFRSVAESARRAVYICDTMGDDSPFMMLAKTRADNYDDWKEIFVRFRPLDGGVF